MEQIKKLLWGVFAIVLVVVAIVWFVNSDLKHIEDTNGADNYSLTTITDENIIKQDIGALGGPTISKNKVNKTVKFSAKEFTGVSEILYDNYIAPSDFTIDMTDFKVTKGNFKMAVVHDDKIVATLEPDQLVEYRLDDVTGTVSLRIAGESADFEFSMFLHDYDMHTHD